MTDDEYCAVIERLGWHQEHPMTGKLVLINPDGPKAAAALSAMLEERDKAREYGGQARIRENKAEDARISAQSRITDLEQKLAKAREALEPFAASSFGKDNEDTDDIPVYDYELTVGNFRRARSTLEELK